MMRRPSSTVDSLEAASPNAIRVWHAINGATERGSNRCGATNGQLAELAHCSAGSVTRGLKELSRANLITSYYASTRRVIEMNYAATPERKRKAKGGE